MYATLNRLAVLFAMLMGLVVQDIPNTPDIERLEAFAITTIVVALILMALLAMLRWALAPLSRQIAQHLNQGS